MNSPALRPLPTMSNQHLIGIIVPKAAPPTPLHRASGVVVPFKPVPDDIDLNIPLTHIGAEYIAAQLVAGYGSDALQLAARHADKLFEEGGATKFANWCLVIRALEELTHVSRMAKRQKG